MDLKRGELPRRFTKGYTWTPSSETRIKMSEAAKRRWQDPEYREKVVEAHRHPNPEHSVVMKKLWKDPEYREKQRIAHRGCVLSKETREKISKALRRIDIPEEELREFYVNEGYTTVEIARLYKISPNTVLRRMREYEIKLRTRGQHLIGKSLPKKVKDKISKSKKGQRMSPATEFKKGFKAPKEWRDKWSKIMKKKWTDPSYVKKIMKARHARPNKPETRLIEILKMNNLPFNYTGDGKFIIDGLCPDFTHKKENKVIEVFGRVYHDPSETFKEEIPWHQQYWGRLARYSQSGYDCLILWDDKLDDEIEVVEKIRRLNNV